MSRRCPLLWKLRRRTMTIPAELHQQIARSCSRINEVPSEVLRVRPLPTYPSKREKYGTAREIGTRPAQ